MHYGCIAFSLFRDACRAASACSSLHLHTIFASDHLQVTLWGPALKSDPLQSASCLQCCRFQISVVCHASARTPILLRSPERLLCGASPRQGSLQGLEMCRSSYAGLFRAGNHTPAHTDPLNSSRCPNCTQVWSIILRASFAWSISTLMVSSRSRAV